MSTSLEQATKNAEEYAKKIAADIKAKDDQSIHTFALLTALNAGATKLVEQQKIQLEDLKAPKKATYSNSETNIFLIMWDLYSKKHEKPVIQQNEYSEQERQKLAKDFKEQILFPCFPKKTLPEPVTSSDIELRLDALEKSKQFLDGIINEVSKETNDSKKQDMNIVLSEGFDKVYLAMRYSFPQSSQDLSEEQLQRLNKLKTEIVAKQMTYSEKVPLLKPSIDIIANGVSSMDKLTGLQIQAIQIRMAEELGLRNPDNKNYPLSPAEYDRRVELLNNLTKNMPDGPEKTELEAANQILREQLGSKVERYVAYLDVDYPRAGDKELISKIQSEIQKELSDPQSVKELTSDVESRDKLMKVMDARLDKMIESLENYGKKNEKAFTADDKKRLDDLKSLKETQKNLRADYPVQEQPQAGPQNKIG